MTDKDVVPFHEWAANARKRMLDINQHARDTNLTTPQGSNTEYAFNAICEMSETLATLLNVMATEAASRFEADVKGRADDQRARPPTIPENVPRMTWYVFQCMPADKNRAPYRVFGMGRDPEDAEDQIFKTEGDEFFLVGWH